MDGIRMKKYEGLGNDYLVLDPNKFEIEMKEEIIKKICNRHLGAGADGLLYGPIMEEGGMRLRIFNSDGSEAEKSGNGVRIFAKYLRDENYVQGKNISFFTISGEIEIEYLDEDGSNMRVNMGKPSFAGSAFPTVGIQESEIVNEPLSFDGNFYNATCLSVGNPNCVIMMEDVNAKVAEDLGPYVEHSQYFPNRMNMELLKVIDRENLQVENYERGSGYTLAWGTGAVAAAAAARRMGLVDSKVTVHMPGGELIIDVAEDDTMYMTGSVGYVGEFIFAEDFFG
jgi:diaminopimelate epimerase